MDSQLAFAGSYREGIRLMGRKAFNRKYKMAVAKLVLDYKIPAGQVAEELSIDYSHLHRWLCEYKKLGDSAFPVKQNALSLFRLKQLPCSNMQLCHMAEVVTID